MASEARVIADAIQDALNDVGANVRVSHDPGNRNIALTDAVAEISEALHRCATALERIADKHGDPDIDG